MSSEGDPAAVKGKTPQWAALWPVPLVTHCSCTGKSSLQKEDTLGCGQWKCLGWLEGAPEDQGQQCRGRGMNGDARKEGGPL